MKTLRKINSILYKWNVLTPRHFFASRTLVQYHGRKHHLHVHYKLQWSALPKYASAATAFSTTEIITDMREGRRLTIFRRSIHLCPVIADCGTMFKKQTPNCTNSKNVHLLCIHVPFWPSTTPHLQNKQTRTNVYNVHPTHLFPTKTKWR